MSERTARRCDAWRELRADWEQAHEQLSRLARCRAGLDFEEGRWLLVAQRGRVHERLGYASFAEYVGRLFGYSAKLVQEKLRVAEALEPLPRMSESLQRGSLCWSAVRELTRVATPETEEEWQATAQNRTVRELEALVSGHAVGSRPGDPRDRTLMRHILRFEVTGEVLASFREALAKLKRDTGEALSDDDALLLMARAVLEGPRDEGRASYQMALTVCEQCAHATAQGNGEAIDVAPEVAEMAACDAQHIGSVGPHAHVGADTQRATQSIPPAVRRFVLRRDHGRCVVPGCRHATWVDVHHLDPRADGGLHDPGNLVTLCCAHHRALHRGHLFTRGNAGPTLRFFHADGSAYGLVTSPATTDTQAKTFRALRQLGFSESEAKQALLHAHVGDASVEEQLRACLGWLTERRAGIAETRANDRGAEASSASLSLPARTARLPSTAEGSAASARR